EARTRSERCTGAEIRSRVLSGTGLLLRGTAALVQRAADHRRQNSTPASAKRSRASALLPELDFTELYRSPLAIFGHRISVSLAQEAEIVRVLQLLDCGGV